MTASGRCYSRRRRALPAPREAGAGTCSYRHRPADARGRHRADAAARTRARPPAAPRALAQQQQRTAPPPDNGPFCWPAAARCSHDTAAAPPFAAPSHVLPRLRAVATRVPAGPPHHQSHAHKIHHNCRARQPHVARTPPRAAARPSPSPQRVDVPTVLTGVEPFTPTMAPSAALQRAAAERTCQRGEWTARSPLARTRAADARARAPHPEVLVA